MDMELTLVEKAIAYDKNLQVNKLVPPSFVTLSKDISTTANTCLDLSDYVFTAVDGDSYSEYYNGVVDGYYVPSESGLQELFVRVKNGGVRVLLDNNVIINEWFNHEAVLTDVSGDISQNLDLDAGVPYPIRIEFFHGIGDFSLELWASGSDGDYQIPHTDCYTIAAYDNCGSRDETFLIASKNANHQRNDGIYVSNPTLGQPTGIVSEANQKSALLASPSYIRIPNHASLNLPSTSSVNYTTEWSIEVYAKLPSVYDNDGEYLSNWSNASSTS